MDESVREKGNNIYKRKREINASTNDLVKQMNKQNNNIATDNSLENVRIHFCMVVNLLGWVRDYTFSSCVWICWTCFRCLQECFIVCKVLVDMYWFCIFVYCLNLRRYMASGGWTRSNAIVQLPLLRFWSLSGSWFPYPKDYRPISGRRWLSVSAYIRSPLIAFWSQKSVEWWRPIAVVFSKKASRLVLGLDTDSSNCQIQVLI